MEATAIRALLDDLASSEARFHGWAPEVEVNWGLNNPALELLIDVVAAGQRTLETGVGYSTVVFGAAGTTHTAVSPFAFEHERVQTWCREHDIDLASVAFVAEPSQAALPSLDPTSLDLVLIDGDHAFPTPFIDFYYAGSRLEPGGLLLVDDTHLRACRLLVDFLRSERGRWRVHSELETTIAFERLDGPLIPPEGWEGQPWGATPLSPPGHATPWQRLRYAVRLRTRLRALRDRTT